MIRTGRVSGINFIHYALVNTLDIIPQQYFDEISDKNHNYLLLCTVNGSGAPSLDLFSSCPDEGYGLSFGSVVGLLIDGKPDR